MKNSILIITGGTGGHVIPAVNFFNYIYNRSNNVFLITDKRGYKFTKNINKNNIIQINSSHLSGSFFFKSLALIKLLIGFIQSIIIFIKLKPKTVISFGSYASLTPLICFVFFKFFFKTQLYLHEQNSVVGQTNKIFIKFSNKIFMNFDRDYKSIKKYTEKVSVVGLPHKITKEYHLKKDDKKNDNNFNFLVFAGSQGSLDILIILKEIIDNLKLNTKLQNINFIVQSPLKKQNEIKNLLIENNYNFEIKSFFDNFENILKKTNIVLCRSGAGTINDLINYKIPAIICPLPSAKDNHQFENAKVLSDINCALIVDKNNIIIDEILLFINKVVNDKDFYKSLLNNYSKIKILNASELMWKLILNDQKK